MELYDLGKKFVQILAPNGIFTGILIGLNEKFNAEILLSEIIIYNILFALAYVLLWHEIRLRGIENPKNRRKTKKGGKNVF